MEPNMIQNGFEGFGSTNQEAVDTLLKALSTGGAAYNAAGTTLTGGTALMVESLDATMRSMTFAMPQIKLWPMLSKSKATNMFEFYDRQTSYGESQNGGFFDAEAGVAPDEQTSQFNRQGQAIKFMGTTRQVTHPMTLVRPAHGPVLAKAIKDGTMWILQNLERQLFEANSFFQTSSGFYLGDPADVPTNSAKFNGIEQQVRYGDSDTKAQYTGWEEFGGTESVIEDLQGAVPDEDDLENLTLRVLENHGIPTHLAVPYRIQSDLNKVFYPKERIAGTQMGAPGKAGFQLTEFLSAAGPIKMMGDVFLRPRSAPAAAQTGAPATPGATTQTAVVDANSVLPAGTYYYRVAAFNNKGGSAANAEVTQAILAGERANLVIPAGTAGAIYYGVYRSAVSGSGWKFIGFIKDSLAAGGGGATFKDIGKKSPGLSNGYLLTMSADEIYFRQLAPLMKMDLAIISPAYRFMCLHYGAEFVTAPLHHALWDRIGVAA